MGEGNVFTGVSVHGGGGGERTPGQDRVTLPPPPLPSPPPPLARTGFPPARTRTVVRHGEDFLVFVLNHADHCPSNFQHGRVEVMDKLSVYSMKGQ